MIDELFAKFDGAYAQGTLRAYRADFAHYSAWCAAHDLDPMALQVEDFVRYIDHMAATMASSTVRRHIACISTLLRLSERQDVTKSADVELAVKRMHRQKGRAQKQAVPLTRNVLEQLLRACDTSPRGLRNRLLLRLGYETMRRRAELCAFRFEDLEVLPNGKAALHLRFSKTDQYGVGKLLPVSEALLADIQQWGELAGTSGYLLRRIYRMDVIGKDLDPASVNRIVQDLQRTCGLTLGGQLSGHSFRVGAALDLLEQGESLEKIMLRGGWNAESTVIKYLRAWQAIS
jgi:site-specific recombinase XerD